MVKCQCFSFRTSLILCMCLAFLSVSFAQELTPVAIHGRLHIKGNKFIDKYDKPVTLHGMCNYNWADQGTQYFNTTAITRMAKEWKCTVIRCVLLPRNAGSQTNKVDTVVRACAANGIYVIINWHSMGGANASDASKWYIGLAEKYKDYPNVMYEPWNEPVGESWATIKAYMETVIKAIRPIDSNNIIICGNPDWDQHPEACAANPITITNNLAYTIHFYAASHKFSDFRKRLVACMDSGIALFATEYGTSEATGGGRIDTGETRKWYNFMDSNGIGCTNWSLSALGESSAAFFDGTSSTAWTDANIKPSGLFVRAYIQSKYEETVTGVVPPEYSFSPYDRNNGTHFSFTNQSGKSMLFTLNGCRIIGAANKQSRGIYIYQTPGNVKAHIKISR